MKPLLALLAGVAYGLAISRMLGCCEHNCGGRRKCN